MVTTADFSTTLTQQEFFFFSSTFLHTNCTPNIVIKLSVTHSYSKGDLFLKNYIQFYFLNH